MTTTHIYEFHILEFMLGLYYKSLFSETGI